MERTNDTIVILHGIGHTRWNMIRVEKAATKAGYKTINITYPSLRMGLKDLAAFIHAKLIAEKIWDCPGQVHFATHSMGGLVAQRYLEDFKSCIPAGKMGRLAMIAPPNGGSEVADFLRNFLPYKWFYGPAGQELTTAMRQANQTCPWYETGIIAGNRGWPYFVAKFLIAGDHDGRVAVEKTKIAGMKDHIIVPCTHSFISWNRNVHDQIIEFLQKGNFADEK
ncbi:MAG TPA: alpha/beta fold hydrolase [Micavibrio sp.]